MERSFLHLRLNSNQVTLCNRIQIFIWTFIAIWILPGSGHFLYDEAYFYHQAIRLATQHQWSQYGPFISGTYPVAFTPGGALWGLLSIPFLFSYDPRFGVAWIILLSAFGIGFFDESLRKIRVDPMLRLFLVFYLIWSNWHNWMVDRIWNVHFFGFLSLMLLSFTLRILNLGKEMPGKHSFFLFFLLGVTSAVMTQVHIGGGLAVLICLGLICFLARAQIRVINLLFYAAAVSFIYAPYIYQEWHTDWVNTKGLRTAHSFKGWNRQALIRSLFSPLIYSSYFESPRALFAGWKGNLAEKFAFVGSWVAMGVALCALKVSNVFRNIFLVSGAIAPFYFLATQRPFHDHYLASLIPYDLFALGLGTYWLYQRGGHVRRLAWVHCIVFVILASVQSFGHIFFHPVAPTLSNQIDATKQTIAENKPYLVEDKDDAQAFIQWVLAKDYMRYELRFEFAQYSKNCSLQLESLRRIREQDSVVTLGPDSYLLCNQSNL